MSSSLLAITDKAYHSVVNKQVDLNIGLSNVQISRNKTVISPSGAKNTTTNSHSKNKIMENITKHNLSRDLVKGNVVVMDAGYEEPAIVKQQKSKALIQGQQLPYSEVSGDSSFDVNDVIAEKYKAGERQRILAKIKPKKKSPSAQVFYPKIVKPSQSQNVFAVPTKAEDVSEAAVCTTLTAASEAVGLATQAAIGPFIQIQNALETQITSLVSTLQAAHTTEKDVLSKQSKVAASKENEVLYRLEHMAKEINDLKKSSTSQYSTTKSEIRSCNDDKITHQPALRDNRLRSPPRVLKNADKEVTQKYNKPAKKILRHMKPVTDVSSSIPQAVLLQTPVPRRKAPKPFSHRLSESGKEHTDPRLSRKGVALLQEIMKDVSTPPMIDVAENVDAPPPPSYPTPVIGGRDYDNTKIGGNLENKKIAGNLDDLQMEVQNIMNETTELKDSLREVNKEMLTVLCESNLKPPLEDRKTKTQEKLDVLVDHSLSEECPIDKYLNRPQKIITEHHGIAKTDTKKDTTKEHAMRILREAQEARERLEKNLFDVARKHKELDLFGYLENSVNDRDENVLRIRKEVSEKIQEIQNNVQLSLKKPLKENSEVQNSKKTTRIPLMQRYKREVGKPPEKVATKPTKSYSKLKAAKQKKLKETLKPPPPTSSTAYDDLIMQHIYGRQPHQAHRHTLKTDNKQFCLPDKKKLQNKYVPQFSSTDHHQPHPKNHTHVNHSKDGRHFYFYPQTGFNNNNIHMTGELYPTATPLAEPSYDPSGRLPLYVNPENTQRKQKPVKEKTLTKTGPNVAVINMRSEDMNDLTIKDRIRSRVRERLKNKMKLNVQSLPNVDIDTTEPSSFSTTESSISEKEKWKKNNTSAKLTHPDEKSYEFQDFIEVKDYSQSKAASEDEETLQGEDESVQEVPLAFSGVAERQPEYHGPAFPPAKYSKDEYPNEISTVTPLEQKAQEWLEQELLARIVGQLDQQSADPTLQEFADNVEVVDINGDEDQSSYNWIDNLIGLQGIQLFIDAGIPVDKDLIRDLVRGVIIERLNILFGYPPPLREEVPIQGSVADEHEASVISTPRVTPIPSPVVSEKVHVKTPEETITDLEEQSIDETVKSNPLEEKDISYPLVHTPASSLSESHRPPSVQQIATPTHTEKDSSLHDIHVNTPNQSEIDHVTYVEQDDFIATVPSLSSEDDKRFTPKDLEETPKPPRVVIPPERSPSTPSTTYTMTSTAVGLSTFEGISAGEHLHPSQVISEENVSEGELGVSAFGMKSVEEIENELFPYDHDTQGTQIKLMMKELLQTKKPGPVVSKSSVESTHVQNERSEGEVVETGYIRSAGEVTHNSVRHEIIDVNTDEDTLEEISINENLPYQRNKNHMPDRPRDQKNPTKELFADKSEGEIITSQSEYHGRRNENHRSSSFGTNSRDVLSIGELAVQKRIPGHPSPLVEAMSEMEVALSQSEHESDQAPNNIIPHLITVRSRPNAEEKDVIEDFLSEDEHSSVEPQRNDEFGLERDEDKVKMILRLPGIEDEDNVEDEEEEQDLSHYDLSTLSGGEI
ncbi:TALPID3 protein-like isoform X2 [Hydractinia symbiolongicarpus]|uniref:TALPID3 protein-like isoform X2 n=1 Tax=Hydractinia symbiolongicarpus TaxID=13093 RepID=UPI00254B3780|nr:TALPID3 protein-like isoform X2 [Hydractinia symbiolongicarpus]